MFDYLQRLLAERGLAHGYCLLWNPALIWTHVVSDALIGLSYFSIPIVLARFITKRRDVQFGFVVWMFAAFIMACGATHFLSILVLWVPAYGIEALVKLGTAIVSVITAIALWPLLPRAIALPSPAQLQRANDDLRGLVAERDAALGALERESAERRNAEDMLRQAQKMDAVGQLTSGIAHDFNNLLTIIVANVDRAQRLAGDPRAEQSLTNAMAGAERAAKLTDQLLAFSRKQPLLPSTLKLNDIIAGMRSILERTLGPNVVLRFDLTAELPPISVDRNQTENAILNLALNARDAMPDGGTLTIATGRRRGEAGDRVALEISDTGAGMTPEVLEHAVEPFFTTKPLGEGTGLGLSQVYGFAKQSAGDIDIRSALGDGTTVTLLLPIVQAIERRRRMTAQAPRVLIVEDEPLVREIACEEFSDAGFEVVSVPDGHAAVETLSRDAAFDLLFTDIRMPGSIDGWSVAATARRHRPEIAVIYATGFSEEQNRMVERAVFFRKPYRVTAILQAAATLGVPPGGQQRAG